MEIRFFKNIDKCTIFIRGQFSHNFGYVYPETDEDGLLKKGVPVYL